MRKHQVHLIAIAFFTSLLTGCSPRIFAHTPTVDMNAIYTQVAASLTAAATQEPSNTPWVITATPSPTATLTNTQEPTQTPWIVTATYTNTPLITNTPTKTATPIPSKTPQNVCNRAELVAHLTIPPGTFMALDKEFTKIWRLKNTGTCAWTDEYDLVFNNGINMANKNSYSVPGKVKPGETVDISIKMVSPAKPGDYTSNWLLRSDTGQGFGLTNANSPVSFNLMISAQVHASFEYDFAAVACTATWTSGAGTLTCPGSASGAKGFVMPTLKPVLETRHEDEPGLWLRPNHAGDGYIRGVFPLFRVSDGDHFVAAIGCHGASSKWNVRFSLSYLTQNGVEKHLGSWNEKNDGLLKEVDLDLSSLAGASIRFVFMVEPNNQSFDQANAIWFLPSIRD